jgi:hypothetical protein
MASTPGIAVHSMSGSERGLAATYRGYDGAAELWNALLAPWADRGLLFTVERIEDLGDTVLALLDMQAGGDSSGVPVTQKWAHVVAFSNGDQHMRSYATWDEGLKAVGLEQ